MTMSFDFRAENPDDMSFTLKVTMSLRQWRELSETLRSGNGGYPAIQFLNAIHGMSSRARASFGYEADEDKAEG